MKKAVGSIPRLGIPVNVPDTVVFGKIFSYYSNILCKD